MAPASTRASGRETPPEPAPATGYRVDVGGTASGTVPAMDASDGYFGEAVAAQYDESSAEMFDPQVVEPVVDVLAELAGSGRAHAMGRSIATTWRRSR